MKVRNVFLRVLTVTMFAAIFVFTAAVVDRSSVKAFRPVSDPCPNCRLNFGMLGITREQTARLNVVNWGDGPIPADDRSEPVPDPDRPTRVEMIFLDSWDNVLRRSTETLMPGHAAFLVLDGATLPRDTGPPSAGGNRTQVRAKIRLIEDPNMLPVPAGDRNLAATVEVFDNFGLDAGKSRFALNAYSPVPDAGKMRMGWTSNHNETILRGLQSRER